MKKEMKNSNINVRVPKEVKAHMVEMCNAYGEYGMNVSQSNLIIKLIEEKYEIYESKVRQKLADAGTAKA